MIRTGDYRENKSSDEADFQANEDDAAALNLGGKNPLAEEELIEEDVAGDGEGED